MAVGLTSSVPSYSFLSCADQTLVLPPLLRPPPQPWQVMQPMMAEKTAVGEEWKWMVSMMAEAGSQSSEGARLTLHGTDDGGEGSTDGTEQAHDESTDGVDDRGKARVDGCRHGGREKGILSVLRTVGSTAAKSRACSPPMLLDEGSGM